MKLPIESSELGFSVLTSALFVIMYPPVARLTGASFVPTAIEHLLMLYILHFCISVTFYCLKNVWKKPTAPPGDDSENGNVT